MRDKQVHAPYNFVSFPNKVIRRYARLEDVPRQDRWDEDLLSGEITVTMTAKTPIFISDGAKDNRGRGDGHFVRDAEGRCIIPGSSLRGLVRENMQILGCGLVRPNEDFQDVNLYYRALADASGSLKGKLKEHYQRALGIQVKPQEDGQDAPTESLPSNVKAGYLHAGKPAGSGDSGYYIRPAKSDLVRIPRKLRRIAPATGRKVEEDNPVVAQWLNKYQPFAEPVYYWYVSGKLRLSGRQPKDQPGAQPGWLISPGYMEGQNHLYLFPEEDPDSSHRLRISQEDRLSYEEDYEARKNTLGGTQRFNDPKQGYKEKERRKRFWALPKLGQRKPVFYCQIGQRVNFSPSSYYPRIAYDQPLRAGLLLSHQAYQGGIFLDYPYAVLGFSQGKTALRSRVSFGDLVLESEPSYAQEQGAVLGEPKLSFFPAYVQEGKDYNQPGFQFRGYKQYWLHQPPKQSSEMASRRVGTTLRPLAAGSRFTGTIRYRNLHPDELGLLLWCLRLEEGCYQPMGMAKPLGYGRMTLAIDALRPFRPLDLYPSLIPDGAFFTPLADPAGRVAELIGQFQASPWAAGDGETPPIQEMAHVQEFFTIRSLIAVNQRHLSYMKLKKPDVVDKGGKTTYVNEYQNVAFPLDSISALREEMLDAGGQKSWPVGTVLSGTVKRISEALVFVGIRGHSDQRVYYKNVPGGSYGRLEELMERGQAVTIRLDHIDPKKGLQWFIDQL